MTNRTALFLPLYIRLISLWLLLSLSACSPRQNNDINTAILAPQNTKQEIELLLQHIKKSTGYKRQQLQLSVANLFLKEQQYDLASKSLASLALQQLSNQDFVHYSELRCRLQIQQGQYNEALMTLEQQRFIAASKLFETDQQLLFSGLRAKVLSLLGSHLASAQQRIYNDPLLSNPEQQAENRRSIWRSLMHLDGDELSRYQQTAFGKDYQGWLALALIVKTAQSDLDEQVRQLDKWQLNWPLHPANQPLPEDLTLLRELAATQAKQIALILPFTGKLAAFGQAVRDGLMAAHYAALERNSNTPTIKIYNSATGTAFKQLYQQTIQEGAEVVIGPLDKSQLNQLFELNITVPTLALNRIDSYGIPPAQLFQFGLAPEDESRQLAELAFLENRRKTLVISPNSQWGQKVSTAFSNHWQNLGGEILGSSVFGSQQDYSKTIKNALLLQHSEARANRIRRLTGEQIEFVPRRRQDLDMIFLLARPEQARSIKPLLNYHYASNLPIYATSRVYSGYEDREKDSDINDIRFTDIPWVLKPASRLKLAIDQELNNSKLYQRMYALGVDAYQLYPRLKQLQTIANSRVYGETGTLKLNSNNQIERTVLLAKFSKGRAKIISAADQSLYNNTGE